MVSDRELFFFGGIASLYLPSSPSSLSKRHKEHPWGMDVNGQRYEVGYWPGDSRSGMFGGNSNWRGPICEYFFRSTYTVSHQALSQGSLPISC